MTRIILGLAVICAFALSAKGDQREAKKSALPSILAVLGETDDVERQLDILKGLNKAFEGVSAVEMPEAWPAIEKRLSRSEDQALKALRQRLQRLIVTTTQALFNCWPCFRHLNG